MAKPGNTQHELDGIRSPRVQVTYDVETRGAIEKKELPFLMGVVGDYAGNTASSKRLKDRRFVSIDRDNFNSVLKETAPSLAFRVNDTLTGKGDESKLNVQLKFESIEDFSPDQVVRNVEPLKKLVELRERLSDLRNKMAGNEKLEDMLREIIDDTSKLAELKSAAGEWVGLRNPK